jgi:hypothetical protein
VKKTYTNIELNQTFLWKRSLWDLFSGKAYDRVHMKTALWVETWGVHMKGAGEAPSGSHIETVLNATQKTLPCPYASTGHSS